MRQAALLEISDLGVYYRTVSGLARAVDGVYLTVNRGEILGIAGESGSGKSTLASALLRLIRPPGYIAGGHARMYPTGREPIDLMEVDDTTLRQIRWRHISYIPQGSMNSLNPVMRIRDQFVDVMVEHGDENAEKARERVPELLQQVGLGGHVANMYPHELSGGMKKRGAFARALASDPEVLLLDEPFSALDVATRGELHAELTTLFTRRGVGIVLVTHDIDEAVSLADRALVLAQSPATIIEDIPLHTSHGADALRRTLERLGAWKEERDEARVASSGRAFAVGVRVVGAR